MVAWMIFAAAAVLEVGGDAVIRRGLRGRSLAWVVTGCAMLAFYGTAVNSVKWDFSRLFGVYVAFFAVAGVVFGKFVFRESVSPATLLGLALIVLGGLIIQFGR